MAQVSGSVLIVVKGSSALALSSASLPSWVVFQGLVRLSAAVGHPVPSDPPSRALARPPPAWRRRCWVLFGISPGSPRWVHLGEQGSVSVLHHLGTSLWRDVWNLEMLTVGLFSLRAEVRLVYDLAIIHRPSPLIYIPPPPPPLPPPPPPPQLLWHSICSHSITMKTRKLSRVERLWKVSVFNLFRGHAWLQFVKAFAMWSI